MSKVAEFIRNCELSKGRKPAAVGTLSKDGKRRKAADGSWKPIKKQRRGKSRGTAQKRSGSESTAIRQNIKRLKDEQEAVFEQRKTKPRDRKLRDRWESLEDEIKQQEVALRKVRKTTSIANSRAKFLSSPLPGRVRPGKRGSDLWNFGHLSESEEDDINFLRQAAIDSLSRTFGKMEVWASPDHEDISNVHVQLRGAQRVINVSLKGQYGAGVEALKYGIAAAARRLLQPKAAARSAVKPKSKSRNRYPGVDKQFHRNVDKAKEALDFARKFNKNYPEQIQRMERFYARTLEWAKQQTKESKVRSRKSEATLKRYGLKIGDTVRVVVGSHMMFGQQKGNATVKINKYGELYFAVPASQALDGKSHQWLFDSVPWSPIKGGK